MRSKAYHLMNDHKSFLFVPETLPAAVHKTDNSIFEIYLKAPSFTNCISI